MRSLNNLPPDVQVISDDLLSLYRGTMAEQFVGQELLSAGQDLYYWSHEAKSSLAEVDFLIDKSGKIYPLVRTDMFCRARIIPHCRSRNWNLFRCILPMV